MQNFRYFQHKEYSGYRIPVIILVILTSLAFTVIAEAQTGGSQRPNLLIILADDLGYGDPGGYYGGRAKTPNLNRLAEEGMLFTDFHSNGPMCSPTRAALMTGRYQHRLGIERALPTSWDDLGIASQKNSKVITIAEYLHEAGYRTALYGKWHLGKHADANPSKHGFDDFRGMTCGCGDYFSKTDRNGISDWWHNDTLAFQKGYATNVIANNAVNFIRENKTDPIFLYVAFNAIHFPWQTAEDDGLEVRQKGGDYTGNFPGTRSKLGPHRPEDVPEILIQMIESLDAGVGKILDELDKQGISENTFVFFTSDNGGYLNYNGNIWPKVGSNGILRGQKGDLYEGGHRVPAMARWPGKITANQVSHQTAMTIDLLPTILEITGIPFPERDDDYALDGTSLLPLLTGKGEWNPRTLFWKMDQKKAVRSGKWKLVIPGRDQPAELYDLDSDLSEKTNLATQHPDVVEKLINGLTFWVNQVQGASTNPKRAD